METTRPARSKHNSLWAETTRTPSCLRSSTVISCPTKCEGLNSSSRTPVWTSLAPAGRCNGVKRIFWVKMSLCTLCSTLICENYSYPVTSYSFYSSLFEILFAISYNKPQQRCRQILYYSVMSTRRPPNRKMLQLWSLGLHPLQKNPAGAHGEQPHWNSMVVAHDDARDQWRRRDVSCWPNWVDLSDLLQVSLGQVSSVQFMCRE